MAIFVSEWWRLWLTRWRLTSWVLTDSTSSSCNFKKGFLSWQVLGLWLVRGPNFNIPIGWFLILSDLFSELPYHDKMVAQSILKWNKYNSYSCYIAILRGLKKYKVQIRDLLMTSVSKNVQKNVQELWFNLVKQYIEIMFIKSGSVKSSTITNLKQKRDNDTFCQVKTFI